MAELSLEQQRAKAERYMLWSEEDGLKDAIQAIKQGYMNSIINSHISDKDGRENCYIAIGIVDKIQSHILGVIGGGKIAKATLEQVEKDELSRRKIFNII